MSDGEDQPRDNPSAEIPAERIAFYRTRAQEVLDAHTRAFDAFIQGDERLRDIGDRRLRNASTRQRHMDNCAMRCVADPG